jgi:hypothetical protein
VRTRKDTAWRKNRKFGDVHGGRTKPKITDRIFASLHSVKRPVPGDDLPLVIEDNPSRDYFWPISGDEAREAVLALPKRHHRTITHIWLRRPSERARRADLPFATFTCGSGVRLITLYPWRRDMLLSNGRDKPSAKWRRDSAKFDAETFEARGWWYTRFDLDGLRRFYVEYLLFHEVGHHVDWYSRQWTPANRRQCEEFANQYAASFSRTATYVLNRLDKLRA